MAFDYEKVTWGGGAAISPDRWDFLDHSLHLRYALRALAPVKGRVVEIGCGSGRFIASVKAARPELDCHGCDLSRAALDVAKERPGVRFELSTAERLPYPDGHFGAVLMIDVLEHLEDPLQGLSEVLRVLEPGGVFHLVFPCEGHPFTLLGQVGALRRLKRAHAGHVQQLAPAALFSLLESAGLRRVDTRYSYFLLGQLYDAAVFSALGLGVDMHGKRQNWVERSAASPVSRVRRVVSSLLYAEARLLSRVPLGMTAHVTCRR